MAGRKDRRKTVEFIDLAPHEVAIVHHCGDRITNSLAEEARGDRVELSTMGWRLLVSHLFCYFDIFCVCMQRTLAVFLFN
jgi:hypothetical protein